MVALFASTPPALDEHTLDKAVAVPLLGPEALYTQLESGTPPTVVFKEGVIFVICCEYVVIMLILRLLILLLLLLLPCVENDGVRDVMID